MERIFGTHNSYHNNVPCLPIPSWNYSHPSITSQLESHDIRQLELDIHYNPFKKKFFISHIPWLDPHSSCTLESAMEDITAFTRKSYHKGIFVFFEPKFYYYTFCYELLLEFQRKIIGLADMFRTVTYQEHNYIKSDYNFEGKVTYVLLDQHWAMKKYMKKTSNYRLLFPCGGSHLFQNVNDPDVGIINDLVSKGHIVRTRMDSAPVVNDSKFKSRAAKALQSKAQIVSTDDVYYLDLYR